MLLHFLGAAHEVTGSCYLLQVGGKNVLIDCGMKQGPDEYKSQELDFAAAEIDCVLLTHAHIDHSGLLPLLYKNGFRGKIYATGATCDLCGIMLRDSAHIQMFEAEWRNRKGRRAGREQFIPIYEMRDADGAISCLEPCSYGEEVEACQGVAVRFTDAGHLLGSASLTVTVSEGGVTKKIVFSGDIGNLNQPLICDPEYLHEADYVVMESTYGDRSHGARPDYVGELAKIIQKTFDRGGNVVIPSFAVGRTQELLYFIRQIKAENRVTGHGDFPVYVDSPLAIEATTIFGENSKEYYDEEAKELLKKGINPISFKNLKTAVTSDESREINADKTGKVIISASGMCEAGRIKHHLKHNLWRRECTILFVGYQAEGTLGRAILEGAQQVKLFGEEVSVFADIRVLEGISGHADHAGLLKWISSFEKKPEHVFVTHGQNQVCDLFAGELRETLGFEATAPYEQGQYDLAKNETVKEGIKEKAARKAPSKTATVFERLLAAGQRLLRVIEQNRGGANKSLAKFADQVDNLADKWER